MRCRCSYNIGLEAMWSWTQGMDDVWGYSNVKSCTWCTKSWVYLRMLQLVRGSNNINVRVDELRSPVIPIVTNRSLHACECCRNIYNMSRASNTLRGYDMFVFMRFVFVRTTSWLSVDPIGANSKIYGARGRKNSTTTT